MDVLLLAQTVEKGRRLSARATFRPYQVPQSGNFQYSGFCYIGRNATHIEKLTDAYKRGYTSDRLENVKAELSRNLDRGNVLLPEVIICESRSDFAAILSFREFLRQHPSLNSIPFILDGSGLTEKEILLHKSKTKPDEILFLEACSSLEMKQKIQFLRKIKEGAGRAVLPQIEEGHTNVIPSLHFTKRVFDILVGVLALLIFSPLFLLIGVLIRLESRGPVFYTSKRAGKGYKIFNFYKFRTMVHQADKRMSDLAHLNQY
ncbi:MAG TPA: sugar transferase, partial [Puia sp.]|nr:sugar transferase [Puia sp.]